MKSDFGKHSPSKSPKSLDEENLHTFCKQMLKTRVFRGFYQERRYVESLGGYRDLIVLGNSEKELKNDLEYIRQRISKFYEGENLWVGISLPDMIGAPAGICIWTEVTDLAFGQYWFCVKSVRFREKEVIIKVKVIRSAKPQDEKDESQNDANIEINAEAFWELWTTWKDSITKSAYQFFSQDLNKDNVLAVLKFLSILMLSLMTASLQAVKFIGFFTLRFMSEFRLLLYTCTPIILKIIDLMGKIIGGIFIMVTMIYRDIVGSIRGTPSYPQISEPPIYKSIMDRPATYRSNSYRHTTF